MNPGRLLGGGAALVLGAWFLSTRRAASYAQLHPELRSPFVRFRSPPFTRGVVALMQAVQARAKAPALPDGVTVEERRIPGPPGAPDVTVFVYRPPTLAAGAAAILNIHGGGYVTGSAAAYHPQSAGYARDIGVVVVGVEYRLAPAAPFPGPLEDCYAALTWMAREAEALGIDPARIALVGDSAGGGLAAALAQLAHDRGEVTPAFQLLYYPMLDDRTVLQADHAGRGEFIWRPASNVLGWTSYLGRPPRLDSAPAYAAPARRADLTGLPPAWIGVGTLDLFHAEDRAYAQRLTDAGVPCEYVEVPGAYHAFERFVPDSSVARMFTASALKALRRGLRLS
ncbi:alpha/beta hydrolase [Deinococcus arenae]|uniref:alpha/beta hydrolase n=1 Tax=Deinococcus arenae TaxID=1452751 RepID=UPI000D7D7A91|nr:alpha/beta hydrolase [Deinococcus arenae]AWT36032.1 alpha/beta hydrolase [Deinococcus actinosclerus]